MKNDHLTLGKYLRTLSLNTNCKMLIDTSTWDFTNVIVASNMPDKFIKNAGPGPLNPKPAVLDFKGGMIDAKLLKRRNIEYLVFQIPEDLGSKIRKFPTRVYFRANILNASKDLRKLNQIGEWGVFALQL